MFLNVFVQNISPPPVFDGFTFFQEGQFVKTVCFYISLPLLGIFTQSAGSGVINCGTPPLFTRAGGQDDGGYTKLHQIIVGPLLQTRTNC